MKLIDAYSDDRATALLWRLLQEREPHQNISHRRMPTPAEHQAFIDSRPYAAWYLLDVGDLAGAVYLTHNREIGVGILRRYRGMGYGREATSLVIAAHGPGRYLANINPANTASIRMFADLQFRPLQVTYALEVPA